jgi:hypothetical protein
MMVLHRRAMRPVNAAPRLQPRRRRPAWACCSRLRAPPAAQPRTAKQIRVMPSRWSGARLETGVLMGGAGSEARSLIANAKSRNFFSG